MSRSVRSAVRASLIGALGLALLPAFAVLAGHLGEDCRDVGPRAGRGALARAGVRAAPVWPLPPPRHFADGAGRACGQEPAREPPGGTDTLTTAGPLAAPAGEETADVPRLTLEEAIRTALMRNPEISVAAARVDEREADRLSAWGTFLPDVEVGYGFSQSSTGRLDPTGQRITNTSWFSQLQARYDVFSGLRRFADLRSARRRVSAADARYEEARFETVLRVKTAFYGAVATRRLVQVEEDRVERQEAQLDSVQVQLEVGRVARTDVLRSEVALNNARLALIRARNGARTAAFELARVVGLREPAAPAEDAELEAVPLPMTREQVMTVALRSGPSVEAARAETDAAAAEAWSARSAYLPRLSFTGGWSWQASEFPPENRSWQVFLFGSYPLFDGFRRETEVSRNVARRNAAQAEERAAELELRAAVDSAYSLIQAALASISLSEQTVELAREELTMQQERFRLGRGSILEVQEAQIALQQAEVDLVRSQLDYQVGVARLEYLLGEDLSSSSGGEIGRQTTGG